MHHASYNYGLLAAFSTVLPLDGPATPPCVNPVVEEGARRDEAKVTVKVDDDELITGAGGAYL